MLKFFKSSRFQSGLFFLWGFMETDSKLYLIRHSLAHVLAQAVQRLRPGAKLGFGPAISDGFYYDFILPTPITDEELKTIEKEMKKILKEKQKFSYEDLSVDDALSKIEEMGEPYKAEYARELIEKNGLKTLRFYENGSFVDMCEGPHVDSTSEIPHNCFKIRNIAGAYWRGNSDNTMMTRIYAWAFETKEELDAYVRKYEEGLRRDHKKLGVELDLFHFDPEIGRGLPLWMPNGAVIRSELEKYIKELEFKAGFQTVATPHLASTDLYRKTGHLPYYEEGMFPFMQVKDEMGEVKEEYCLRPMNCPHHHKIFESRPRSYKSLPLRLAEYGQVYRFEDSGSLSGLLRVRGMCMNDGHIYCTEEQINGEFLAVMRMHEELYKTLGIKDFHMRFSTWDPEDPKGKEKYVDNPEAWEKTQKIVKDAMIESGLPFVEGKGEAAFYGPKIDFQLKSVTGREETASTNQLDFAIPVRLNLLYTGSDNKEYHPYVIHRAPAGTHERFIAFLIEHFGGAFPTWLAPVQVMALTTNEKFDDYAQSLIQDLRMNFVRAEIDLTGESLGKRIRKYTKNKVPNILVIGEKEVEEKSVTLRRYGLEEQKTLSLDDFKAWLQNEIKNRVLNEHVLNY